MRVGSLSCALPHAGQDLICFSHLRWDYVLQRPQHLMERFSRTGRVFFFEEVIPTDHHLPYLEFHAFTETSVTAVRPRVPDRASPEERDRLLSRLLDQMLALLGIERPVLWFYTPMMWPIAAHVPAAAVVYDCMDELSAFRFAPPELGRNEAALLRAADVVFTGGFSIFEAKRLLHDNVHPFPSSVDQLHFNRARATTRAPDDQAGIPTPRLGYFGVIDERIDLDLLARVAEARPDWSLVMIGPVAKVGEHELPRRPNIHYLGQRSYDDLPDYVAGWDVALMPFALNEATRFISPTKTPEYLAAGCPVVSTPIRDVVRQYADLAAVQIAAGAEAFVAACAAAIEAGPRSSEWLAEVDRHLAGLSWDITQARIVTLVREAIARNAEPPPAAQFPGPAVRRRVAPPYDVVVAGAGFAGSVIAERLARASGKRILVCDRRSHVGGNAFDGYDAAGVLVHRYGPHIFHTNCDEIVRYLSNFTAWRPYEHRVLADIGDRVRVPMPINRTTLEAVYGRPLADEAAAAQLLAELAEPVAAIRNSRDVVIAKVGRRLYETFFEGYTRKQWGLDPSELDKSVTSRVPTRTSTDDRYFLDSFQAMPRDGFTRLFERMLDHELIDLALGSDYADLGVVTPLTVYTGPIDGFFGHRFGELPYRSLEFRHETHDRRRFQEVAVVNYPDERVPWTRITEHKHLTGQVHPMTSITYEFPKAGGDPFYPIPRPENRELYRQYEALARARSDVIFAGRLGTYQYYNMDQVVGQALATHRRLEAALAGPPRTVVGG
jgi:UDP-galactopyranose mutase